VVFTCRGPYVFENYGISVIIYESLLTVFVISNFGLATFMDPGMYPQGLFFLPAVFSVLAKRLA